MQQRERVVVVLGVDNPQIVVRTSQDSRVVVHEGNLAGLFMVLQAEGGLMEAAYVVRADEGERLAFPLVLVLRFGYFESFEEVRQRDRIVGTID